MKSFLICIIFFGFIMPPQAEGSLSLSLVDADLTIVYASEISSLKSEFPDKQEVLRSASIQKKNIAALREFYKISGAGSLDLSGYVPLEQARGILKTIPVHPVIGLKAAVKYDPSMEIGFCFGRAAYAHWELVRAGVSPQNIAKVFVLGGLYVDGIGWEYHVATIARDKTGHWWVIDSLFDDVITLEDWMSEVSKWDANRIYPQLRFYFTEAAKFQPVKGSYDSERFNSPIYGRYFADLISWYSKNSHCLRTTSSSSLKEFTCQK